jgi:hypothetical protein
MSLVERAAQQRIQPASQRLGSECGAPRTAG